MLRFRRPKNPGNPMPELFASTTLPEMLFVVRNDQVVVIVALLLKVSDGNVAVSATKWFPNGTNK